MTNSQAYMGGVSWLLVSTGMYYSLLHSAKRDNIVELPPLCMPILPNSSFAAGVHHNVSCAMSNCYLPQVCGREVVSVVYVFHIRCAPRPQTFTHQLELFFLQSTNIKKWGHKMMQEYDRFHQKSWNNVTVMTAILIRMFSAKSVLSCLGFNIITVSIMNGTY